MVRIPDVAKRYFPFWTPSRSCCSPFRKDQHASFSVFDDGQAFKDHATGEKGDVVRFLELASGMDTKSAIREIVALAGLNCWAPMPPRLQERPEMPRIRRGTPALPNDLHAGSDAELRDLARLRGLHVEACEIASERGLLQFTLDLRDG